MNVSDSAKLTSVTQTAAATTAPRADVAEQKKPEAPESTIVSLSEAGLKMSTMVVDDPGDWPKPPKNGN